MSPLLSLLEKETKATPSKNEHHEQHKNESGKVCGSAQRACIKPSANCSCRDRKEW